MTTLQDRPVPVVHEGPSEPRGPRRNPIDRAGAALRGTVSRHRRSLSWLAPLLLVAGLVQAIGMAGSPQRIDDEGTYTAQAWAVAKLGELAHYTYWYDHPPLGWLQLAGYAQATFAFERYDIAVIAMREAMLVATLVSVVLLWVLARRLGLSRPAAAAAGLLFAVSPLAVQFHRTVYLDNIATVWLLGAFVLALSKRNQLAGFVGAALAFGVAVLTKETTLLALPFLAWVMWRSARRETRRYTLSVAGATLVVVGTAYVLFALVKGELLPGAGRVSLAEGIGFQLATRQSSGWPFQDGTLANDTLTMWLQLDPVLPVLGLVAAVVALGSRRLRPFAALTVFLAVFALRPGGYLPVPYIIAMLPLLALLVAAVTDSAVRTLRARRGRNTLVRAGAWGALAVAAVVAASPIWFVQLRGLLLADLDAPMRQAQEWVASNVDRSDRVIVDDAMWVDLVRAGFPRENVVWYYKVDTDSAVQAQSPNGWRDSDWVVTTDSMRTFPDGFPQVSEALTNSVVVATFGSGTQAVDVRRVLPQGVDEATAQRASSAERRAALGAQLLANPGVTLSTDAEQQLRAGAVDARLVVALAQTAATAPVVVRDFPAVDGEDGAVRRQMVLEAGGRDQDALAAALGGLGSLAAPDDIALTGDDVTATYRVDPEG